MCILRIQCHAEYRYTNDVVYSGIIDLLDTSNIYRHGYMHYTCIW